MKQATAMESPQLSDVPTVMVPLDLIDPDPTNRRDPPTDEVVQARAASMASVGQMSPALLRPGKNGRYLMVYGHVRALAARSLGWTHLKATIENLDDEQAKLRQAIENLAREDPSPYQQARLFQDLIEMGWKVAAIAKQTGLAVNTVKNRLKLLELPEMVARRVDRNGFSTRHAHLLVPMKEHPEALEAVVTQLVDPYQDVGTVEEFLPKMVGMLTGQKLAVDLSNCEYRHKLPREAWDSIILGVGSCRLKAPSGQMFALSFKVAELNEACEKALANLEAERKAAQDPNVDPEKQAKASGRVPTETKAEKKARLEAEEARQRDRERAEAVRLKARKLMGAGIADATAAMSPEGQSWLAFWVASGGGRPDPAPEVVAVVQAALDLTPSKAAKLLGVDFDGLFVDGKVAVPPLWAEATPENRVRALAGASVLGALEWGGFEAMLVAVTGRDLDGWHDEAANPRRKREAESATEAVPAEASAAA